MIDLTSDAITHSRTASPASTSRVTRQRHAQARQATQEVQRRLSITQTSAKEQSSPSTPISRTTRTRPASVAAAQVGKRLDIQPPSQNPAAKGCTPDGPSVQYGSNAQVLSQKEVDRKTNR